MFDEIYGKDCQRISSPSEGGAKKKKMKETMLAEKC
jgi:hypothetical protein